MQLITLSTLDEYVKRHGISKYKFRKMMTDRRGNEAASAELISMYANKNNWLIGEADGKAVMLITKHKMISTRCVAIPESISKKSKRLG